ncbi:MAG: Xaa-Pro peptidase family protein, partial [Candidatus Nezhaarchaeota archaeon]|nr:Xaa-Pro peptidase family protein [Candidatus Nezhaarchaeota archaeon]
MGRHRLERLKQGLAEEGLSAVILTHSPDVYYFAGTATRAVLIVPVGGEPALLAQVGFERAVKESWVKDVRKGGGVAEIGRLLKELGVESGAVGLGLDVTPANFYLKLSRALSGYELVDASPLVLRIRAVKERGEIELIEKAAEISRAGHRRVEEVLEPGVTELELAIEVEVALRRAGHDGFIRHRTWRWGGYGVIGPSGPNLGSVSGPGAITITGVGHSSAIPYGPSHRRIERGDMVLVDFVTSYMGYHHDEARMYAVGEVDSKKLRSFRLVREAEEAALSLAKPGVPVSRLYWEARRVFEREGLLNYFAAYASYPHYTYLGHGIGLELSLIHI